MRVREGHENLIAAAAIDSSSPTSKSQTGRHTCQCGHTWPKRFGSVCYKCNHDVDRAKRREEELAKLAKEMEEEDRLAYKAKPPAPHVSETAQEMNKAVGGRLPSSWLHHQGLKLLIGDRDFKEVCETMRGIGMRTLPPPEQFFEAYSQHLQEHKRVLKEYKRAQAELPEIEDSLKAMKDALFKDRLRASVSSTTDSASSHGRRAGRSPRALADAVHAKDYVLQLSHRRCTPGP